MCFFDFHLAAHHTYTPTFKICLLSILCQMLLDVRDTNKNRHGAFPMKLSEITAPSFAWGRCGAGERKLDLGGRHSDFDKQSLSQKNSKLWPISPARGQRVVVKARRDRPGAGLTS